MTHAPQEFDDVTMLIDTLDADRTLGDWGCHRERQGRASRDDALDDADVDLVTEAESGPQLGFSGEDRRYLVHQDRQPLTRLPPLRGENRFALPEPGSVRRVKGNWNVIALSDYDPDGTNAGVVVERYSYTAYGRFVVLQGDSAGDQLGNVLMTSAVGNVFAHQGLPMDWEQKRYQNRRREYVALSERFAQRDPLKVDDGIDVTRRFKDGMNLYSYLRENPQSRTDPEGLQTSVYGRYCGLRGPNDPPPFPPGDVPPRDCLDSACKRHDECYDDNGTGWLEVLNPCKLRCDWILCQEAQNGTRNDPTHPYHGPCNPGLGGTVFRLILGGIFSCPCLNLFPPPIPGACDGHPFRPPDGLED